VNPTETLSAQQQRNYALIVHIASLFFPFLAPLIGYVVLKDRGEFIAQHTRAALIFQITVIIASVLLAITIVGLLLIWLVLIYAVIQVIVACVAANNGDWAKFQPTLNLITA
jgi:uncharacterized Tic20 family protein